MKRKLSVLLTVAMLIVSTFSSYAATTYSDFWRQSSDGNWCVYGADGKVIKNAWYCDDAVAGNGKDVWYLIGSDGNMIAAGLVQDKTGNYYSLETAHDGYYGMMRNKSGIYDGVQVNIITEHNGSFGAIADEASINALKALYGVKTIDIDNSNIVYSSNLVKQTARMSSSGGDSGSGSESGSDKTVTIPELKTDGTTKYGNATVKVSENATVIEYTNKTAYKNTATMTVNADQTIIIDAPNDDITLNGDAKKVDVISVADHSLKLNGNVKELQVEGGRVVLSGKADTVTLDAQNKNVSLDVKENAEATEITVDAAGSREVEINDGGSIDSIESATGNITLNISETATKTPSLKFVGEEAVKAYEDRLKKYQDAHPTVEAVLKVGTDVRKKSLGWEDDGTVKFWDISGETFDGDKMDKAEVVFLGDMAKVRFAGCTFKNLTFTNMGTEFCVVMMANCTVENCTFQIENTGRQISASDLIPKFMFVAMDPQDVELNGSNGAALSVGAPNALSVILNGKEYGIDDIEYYVDERKDAVKREIQEYNGQAVNVFYAGEWNNTDGGRDQCLLSENMFEADMPEIAYAYVQVGTPSDAVRKTYNCEDDGGSVEDYRTKFTFDAENDFEEIWDDDFMITCPQNEVTLKGYTFNGKVTVKGDYADVTFENCKFKGDIEKDGQKIKVTKKNCQDIS